MRINLDNETSFELAENEIIIEDIPRSIGEGARYGMGWHLICGVMGPHALVYADCSQDAIDDAADKGLLDAYKLDSSDLPDYTEETIDYAGNNGMPFDFSEMRIYNMSPKTFDSDLTNHINAIISRYWKD